jgi:hypothetical protein
VFEIDRTDAAWRWVRRVNEAANIPTTGFNHHALWSDAHGAIIDPTIEQFVARRVFARIA